LATELAAIANCDQSTIHRFIQRGLLAAERRQGLFVVPLAEAMRFLRGEPAS
jgi:hypothetical protein